MTTSRPRNKENPLLDIIFNVVLPVLALKKLSPLLGEKGPLLALLIGLAIPIVYGAYDYFSKKKTNYLSIFGFANVLMTGGFALMKMEGYWFAVKEAAFPALIGIAVLISAFTTKPFMKTMAINPNVLDLPLIHNLLSSKGNEKAFGKLLKKSTLLLSSSFFMSAFLNFVLAQSIFTPIDSALSEAQQTTLLNEQIAEMTWKGYVVIALPLMLFMIGILVHLFRGITNLTGLSFSQLFPSTTESHHTSAD
ncbi:MAG: hypothetical protein KDD61_13975 [Bdellovibrionales bacterium]|nr:hypothetical protein [Bdellovibrionales bacterium]